MITELKHNKPIEQILKEHEPDTPTAKYADSNLNGDVKKYDNSPTTEDEAKRLLGEVVQDLTKKLGPVEVLHEEVDIANLTPTQGVSREALDYFEELYRKLEEDGGKIPSILVMRYSCGVDVVVDGHHRNATRFYRRNELRAPAYVVAIPPEVDPEEKGAPTYSDLTEEEMYYFDTEGFTPQLEEFAEEE